MEGPHGVMSHRSGGRHWEAALPGKLFPAVQQQACVRAAKIAFQLAIERKNPCPIPPGFLPMSNFEEGKHLTPLEV